MSKSCGGACGGDATSAADTDIQASSEAPGRWVSVYAGRRWTVHQKNE